MKMYKEVIIESEDQARALPPGTLAYAPFEADPECSDGYPTGFRWASISVKYGQHWEDETDPGVGYNNKLLVGWTALVVVEVTEEWGSSRPNGEAFEFHDRDHAENDVIGWNEYAGPDYFQSTLVRRFNTPWEEV